MVASIPAPHALDAVTDRLAASFCDDHDEEDHRENDATEVKWERSDEEAANKSDQDALAEAEKRFELAMEEAADLFGPADDYDRPEGAGDEDAVRNLMLNHEIEAHREDGPQNGDAHAGQGREVVTVVELPDQLIDDWAGAVSMIAAAVKFVKTECQTMCEMHVGLVKVSEPSPDGGDGISLRWVSWDNIELDTLAGRFVSLDDHNRVIFTPKNQTTVRHFADALLAGNLSVLIANTTVRMRRATGIDRPLMSPWARLVKQFYEATLNDIETNGVLGSSEPCAICRRIGLKLPSTIANPHCCLLCRMHYHEECQRLSPLELTRCEHALDKAAGDTQEVLRSLAMFPCLFDHQHLLCSWCERICNKSWAYAAPAVLT